MSETMANAYADDFAKMFNRNAQGEFLDCIRSIYERSEWKRVPSRELRLVALDDEETARSVSDKYELRGKPDVIQDTLRNTKLMLRAGEEFIPVRSTALQTILNRAGIGGKTLFSLDKTHFASFINLCLEKVRGDALLRICVDKVSAVLGGDQSDYAILQMDELFPRMVKYLDEHYPGYEYQGGSIDHSLTWSSWSIADRSLLDSYRIALSRHALPSDGLTASVRLMTSDVGASSVVLYPILRANHRIIPLGTGLTLEHKHQHNLEMFDDMVENLFAGYRVDGLG